MYGRSVRFATMPSKPSTSSRSSHMLAFSTSRVISESSKPFTFLSRNARRTAVVLEHAAKAVPLRLVPDVRTDRDLLDEQGFLRRERHVHPRGRDDLVGAQPTRRRMAVRRSRDFHRFRLRDKKCETGARSTGVAGRRTSPGMSARAACLLFGALCEDSVLGLLGDAEFEHALRGDRDRLAGCRISSHASLPVDDHELANAGDREAAPRFLVRESGELIEELPYLLLGQTGLFRQPIQGLRL